MVLADCTRRVAQVTWEWTQQEVSEEGNHSTASESDVLRKYILGVEMFDRGRGKDQEGRQTVDVQCITGREHGRP